ncbi:hypothetical protein N5C38_20915 [Pseudomonas chengduensis]|nr:hypothetical protein [Pseudomonas chengduensis]MDH1213496.1 hypothetical protein [Pseudomonas chengduensis]
MAFSSEDERSIQGPYLIKGFIENPFFGSGFGGYAGYTRSETSPWLYEMTYHQLLFNLGVLGISILVALFGYYSFKICLFSRRLDSDAVYLPSIAVGLLGLAIGSYSNPYLGSFDFLLLVGFLPVVVAHYGKQRFF